MLERSRNVNSVGSKSRLCRKYGDFIPEAHISPDDVRAARDDLSRYLLTTQIAPTGAAFHPNFDVGLALRQVVAAGAIGNRAPMGQRDHYLKFSTNIKSLPSRTYAEYRKRLRSGD